MVIMKTLDNLKYLNKGLAIFSWIVFMIENLILLKFVDLHVLFVKYTNFIIVFFFNFASPLKLTRRLQQAFFIFIVHCDNREIISG